MARHHSRPAFDPTTSAGYDALWRWSCADSGAFWDSLSYGFGIELPKPYACVLADPKMPGAVWFQGAQVNFARHMHPERAPLPDGRWHFQHGPIDLVLGAVGDASAVAAAHAAAWRRFAGVLPELVAELPRLRAPIAAGAACAGACPLHGPVARRMWFACAPHAAGFVTPMAAVAGAVAEEVLAAYEHAGIARAWVNNGGDIAIRLARGERLRIGVVADLARFDSGAGVPRLDADLELTAEQPVRGIATSGWRGRSFSLGIADSVTVLAASAAAADAAATVVANAVDLHDPRIRRARADSLKDDSDLGARLVTVDVPLLEAAAIDRALAAGAACAEALRQRGWIDAALLVCQRRARTVGDAALTPKRLV